MMSPGAPISAESARSTVKDLHHQVWRRLQDYVARPSAFPAEIALHGRIGIGKTVLLRRLYWDLFSRRAGDMPLFAGIPAAPFSPGNWARRLLLEAAKQWAAYESRDAQLAQSAAASPAMLAGLCRKYRLEPLAEALDEASSGGIAQDPSLAIEWAFGVLAETLERLNRRAILLIDGAENAFWREGEETVCLTRVAPGLSSPAQHLRRIWAMRAESSFPHPLLPSFPPQAEPWLIPGLSVEAAAEFVSSLAKDAGIDYDESALHEFLPLWGGAPKWLEAFVRQAAEYPAPLDSTEQIAQVYVNDVMGGPSSRGLLEELLSPALPASSPAQLADAAAKYVLNQGYRPGHLAREAESPQEQAAIRRLARAGLAVSRSGRWAASDTPMLDDFLRLYVEQNLFEQPRDRLELVLKRDRLLHSAQAQKQAASKRRLQDLQLLFHSFKGQNVPEHLLHAHMRFAAGAPSDVSPHGVFHVPFCIGSYAEEIALSPAEPSLPGVVAWCFQERGFYRSDEIIWVAIACEANVVTSEEVEQAHRAAVEIGHQLGVSRAIPWIITDGRFSPEALQTKAAAAFLSSSWRDIEALADALANGRKSRGAKESAPSAPAAPQPAAQARVVETHQAPDEEHVMELWLPPRADMELMAASNIEQLASKCGFSEKSINQMKMASLEACLNAIEHSRNSEKEIRVRLEGTAEKFTILVENEGATFDPQALEDPNIEDKMNQPYKRGWGIKLIRKFMDRVVFEPYDRGTRLRMEKFKTPPNDEKESSSETAKA